MSGGAQVSPGQASAHAPIPARVSGWLCGRRRRLTPPRLGAPACYGEVCGRRPAGAALLGEHGWADTAVGTPCGGFQTRRRARAAAPGGCSLGPGPWRFQGARPPVNQSGARPELVSGRPFNEIVYLPEETRRCGPG